MATIEQAELEVREDIDGVRWLLPGRAENSARRMVGFLLTVAGASCPVLALLAASITFLLMGVDGVIIVVAAFMFVSGVASGAAMVFAGLWLTRARTEVLCGSVAVQSVVRLGPVRRSRRVSVERIRAVRLAVEEGTGAGSDDS